MPCLKKSGNCRRKLVANRGSNVSPHKGGQMINLPELDDDCNPAMVETLILGAQKGMSRAFVPDVTTTSEVLSAVFTLLDRTLRSIRKLQTSEERFDTASQIHLALNEMLTDHGKVPN